GGSAAERAEADSELSECVSQVADGMGPVMWLGVRAGGGPWLPAPWRWGYGWGYPHPYTDRQTGVVPGLPRPSPRRERPEAAEEEAMKLYGASLSPFVRKVRIILEEKGIPYETEELVPLPKTPALLAMHPLGKIPILCDGDVVVPDSSVICAYLEKK